MVFDLVHRCVAVVGRFAVELSLVDQRVELGRESVRLLAGSLRLAMIVVLGVVVRRVVRFGNGFAMIRDCDVRCLLLIRDDHDAGRFPLHKGGGLVL